MVASQGRQKGKINYLFSKRNTYSS